MEEEIGRFNEKEMINAVLVSDWFNMPDTILLIGIFSAMELVSRLRGRDFFNFIKSKYKRGGTTMKRFSVVLLVSYIFISLLAFDALSFTLGGKELVKNGTGNRTMVFLGTMYVATLWVPEQLKGTSGKEIIEADDPMSIVLIIDSALITRSKFVESTNEGFAKSAAGGYVSARTKEFLDQFKNTEFKKGDVISLNYTPAGLITQYKSVKSGTVQTLGSIPGLDLKKALFAIWLGQDPIQEKLKAALLSGK